MRIFCAEALWGNDISETRISYKSLLTLIASETASKLAHFTFNTKEELDYLFGVFVKKKYDLLYIGAHMQSGTVFSGLGKSIKTDYVDLIYKHKEGLEDKVVHLAGCSSLGKGVNDRKILKAAGLQILSGYTLDADTSTSSAMEILYFTGILNSHGTKEFIKNLKTKYKDLAKETGFRIVTRDYGTH